MSSGGSDSGGTSGNAFAEEVSGGGEPRDALPWKVSHGRPME
jgi:hypothetical protein